MEEGDQEEAKERIPKSSSKAMAVDLFSLNLKKGADMLPLDYHF